MTFNNILYFSNDIVHSNLKLSINNPPLSHSQSSTSYILQEYGVGGQKCSSQEKCIWVWPKRNMLLPLLIWVNFMGLVLDTDITFNISIAEYLMLAQILYRVKSIVATCDMGLIIKSSLGNPILQYWEIQLSGIYAQWSQ